MNTILLISNGPITLSRFATTATSRIRGAEVNVVSDTHVEVHRADDYTTIQVSEDGLDLLDEDEMEEHGIDPERAAGWVLSFPQIDLFREVLGVLAEQITEGWLQDDNGEVTPIAEYRERLAEAGGLEDL